MPTYAEIMEQEFAALEAAAVELDAAADGFENVATDYRRDVASVPGHEELWTGQSAQAASFQFSVTEQELDAAQAEARALAGLLRDGKGELTRMRDQLKAVVEDARAAGYEVTGEGRVLMNPDWPNDTELERLNQVRAEWQAQLDRAVEAVGQADESLHLALARFTAENDGRRAGIFNGAADDTADEVLAARAQELSGKLAAGEELSAEERAELLRLLELEAHDPEFARELLDGIGGEGFVALAAQVAGQGVGGEGDDARDFVVLGDHLRTLLATGTDVPNLQGFEHGQWGRTEQGRFYEQFMNELNEAGRAEYEVTGLTDTDVRGYQLIASIMNSGEADFSSRVLHDLADGVRAAEDPAMGGDPGIWSQGWDAAGLDGLDDADLAWFAVDPMDTMLGIMAQEPGTAASYLDPAGDNGRLEYLIDDREWSHMSLYVAPTRDVDVPTGQDGFGAALQAATTGVPAGELPRQLHLTERGDRIMELAYGKFSENDAALIADGGAFASLRPELARMTGAYMADVQFALSDMEIHPAPRGLNGLEAPEVTSFLMQLARDPEAYGIVTGAQQAYSALAVQDVLLDDERSPRASLNNAVQNALAPGAQVAGVLSAGRADAVYDLGVAGDQEHNERVDMIESWTEVILEEGVGRIAERFPVAGPVIEWGVGELSGSIFSTFERDNSDEAAEEAADGYYQDYLSAREAANNAVTIAAGGDESLARDLRNDADDAVRNHFRPTPEWDASNVERAGE
ncbi:hypothetical protein [Streptomyces marincola]|uniref:hypothetical protein n=1 Tax=Streptomyces marincola TaxID=2878388 RepID=UPI001CF43318|nr:hypothetical protein [Streptomyces marincola]UCM89203.1 hypothetical protein LC193_15315 [Streptomyces marincola]